MTMKLDSKDKVFIHELKDLYSAEKQLIEALPKVIDSVDGEAKKAFSAHLEQTKTHAKRIEQIMVGMEYEPSGVKCVGMEGLIEEGKEMMQEDELPQKLLIDALVTGGQKIEKYEITVYESAIKVARELGHNDAAATLQQSLSEEEAALKILQEIG